MELFFSKELPIACFRVGRGATVWDWPNGPAGEKRISATTCPPGARQGALESCWNEANNARTKFAICGLLRCDSGL